MNLKSIKKIKWRKVTIITLVMINLFYIMPLANVVDNFRSQFTDGESIILKEQVVSLNEQYQIYKDRDKVGEINGKYINLTGDIFTLTDKDGNEISSEKQIKRWNIKFNRMAQVYDENRETIGYIGEQVIKDMFKIGTSFHFFDKNKNEIAELRQKFFSILPKYEIKDSEGNLLYTIKKKLYWKSKYKIEVHDSSIVPVDQVIFITAIMNEIKQAKAK